MRILGIIKKYSKTIPSVLHTILFKHKYITALKRLLLKSNSSRRESPKTDDQRDSSVYLLITRHRYKCCLTFCVRYLLVRFTTNDDSVLRFSNTTRVKAGRTSGWQPAWGNHPGAVERHLPRVSRAQSGIIIIIIIYNLIFTVRLSLN